MKRLAYVVGVVVVWVLAWGTVSIANVLSGIAIGLLVAVIVPEREMLAGRVAIRPIAIMRLGWFFVATTAAANVAMIRLAFKSGHDVPAGVLDCPTPPLSDVELTMVTSLMALSPGSITVDAQRDPWVLSVHFLDITDAEAQREWVARLVERCQAVTGTTTP